METCRGKTSVREREMSVRIIEGGSVRKLHSREEEWQKSDEMRKTRNARKQRVDEEQGGGGGGGR